jgi:hypothetical protein
VTPGAAEQNEQVATQAGTPEPRLRKRLIAFRILIVLFALLHVFMTPLPYLVLAFFIEGNPDGISHQVHELCFGALFAMTFVGLISQLRNPERKIAGMYQVIVPLFITVPLVLIVDRYFDPTIPIFLILPLVLLWLHPAREPGWNPSVLLVVLAGLAAVPLLVFAVHNIATGVRASSVGGDILREMDPEATEGQIVRELEEAGIPRAERVEILHSGHWVAMGGFALSVIGLSLLGALRPRGWRLLIWSSAAALSVYALASLRYPSDASAMSGLWAGLALAWAVLLVMIAERGEMDVARPDVAPT